MLGKIKIATERDAGVTSVPNAFIDQYMAEANDAGLKIYLYLLRVMQSGRATTVPEIADRFNLTERDVKRALQFWEKRGLVHLEYDDKKRLVQIGLEDLSENAHEKTEAAPEPAPAPAAKPKRVSNDAPARRRYSADEVEQFAEDENLAMALFAAEQYFNRSLNPTEMQTILYIYEELAFPTDLIDYLLQYTAENAKGRYAAYMEKTAIAWRAEGIDTVEAAKQNATRYDKRVYEIMRALGLSNAPTSFETTYFNRWLGAYGFSMDVVLEACRRTVSRTQTHRVEYTDGILKNWRDRGVSTTSEIARAEEAREIAQIASRRKEQKTSSKTAQTDTRNRFNRIKQQDYDFDELKHKLVSNN